MLRSPRAFASPLFLLLLLSVFGWAPLLDGGYFLQAHDAAHSLFWLVEFDRGIRDGFLWPRWAADHVLGYGYPLFTFYAPLAFYIAEAFHLLGAGIGTAVKLTWGLAFVLAGVTMYRFAARLWGQTAGLVAGLLYLYAPYHLVNLYVRAALAEFVAMALFPWVLHAFWDVLTLGGWRRAAWAGLSLGLTLLTHSVTLLVFPPFLVTLVLYGLVTEGRGRARRAFAEVTVAGLLAGGLATIFLLPALAESGYIVQTQWLPETYRYERQFVYFFQLFDFTWGFGHALPGPDDGMSQQIGLWPFLLGLAALPLLCKRPLKHGRILVGFAVAALIAIAGTLAISQPVWAVLPPLALIQFPFRLLGMVNLFLALTAGGVVATLLETVPERRPILAVLSLALVLASYPYTRPQHTPLDERHQSPVAVIDFELAYPDMRGSTAFAAGPPATTPKLAAYLAGEPLPLAGIIAGEGEVESVRHGGGSARVRVRAFTPVTLQFYTYWYPGWRATVNGRPVPIRAEGPDALITLDLPAGEHEVSIRFANTPLRTAAGVVSLATLLIILFLLIRPINHEDTKKQRDANTVNNTKNNCFI
ncbi:MAG: 6-pyruvoyl-tetrahydropterin synthase-related protein [Anaerolineae bacterium]|nr:6-pyruvoyl-tetrahydropterin synthase-related protein [Caldilineales bacterium]MDW8268295.1 6-pyruvoyl-tetrahydropterin synthase-related protein [Anaerolineae bacterium]